MRIAIDPADAERLRCCIAGDSADGKRLHHGNCMECHDTTIYTRKDRIVGSLDALKMRLGDCSHMAKKEF